MLNVGTTFFLSVVWAANISFSSRNELQILQIEVERLLSKQREVHVTTENNDIKWTSAFLFKRDWTS